MIILTHDWRNFNMVIKVPRELLDAFKVWSYDPEKEIKWTTMKDQWKYFYTFVEMKLITEYGSFVVLTNLGKRAMREGWIDHSQLIVSHKNYYCPVCGNKEKHSTNHFGEIYCNCKKCSNGPLYNADVDVHKGLTYRVATLHYYNLYTEKSADRLAYQALCGHLHGQRLKKFTFLETHPLKSIDAHKPYDGKKVKLFQFGQFEGQYVSDIGRLHDWREATFANSHCKRGYYLKISGEKGVQL